MTEELLEVPKFLKPVKKKAKNGRKKVKITGPKIPKKKQIALAALVSAISENPIELPEPLRLSRMSRRYAALSTLKETVFMIEQREGRSMQLTGDAKLLIKAIKELTKISECLIEGNA